MPWPWVRLPQKIRHSVGLSRITDKLVPSNDWKKSFIRSLTHAWGSRDHLSRAVKIQTSRLYFSCRRAPSAMVAVTGKVAGDLMTGSTTWSSLLALPTVPSNAPRRDGGGPALAGSSFIALDPPGIFGIYTQVRQWCYKSGRTLWIWASPVAALRYCVEQLKEWTNDAPTTLSLNHLDGYPPGRPRKVINQVIWPSR